MGGIAGNPRSKVVRLAQADRRLHNLYMVSLHHLSFTKPHLKQMATNLPGSSIVHPHLSEAHGFVVII